MDVREKTASGKRLIDADVLLEHLTRCMEQSKGLTRSVCVAIKCFVEQIPTVEVVRCKDCKHRYEDSWCEYVDDDDNFYCAGGERKEGQA